MTPPTPPPFIPPDDDHVGPPPRDELDALLRQWHAVHADRARAGRDRLLAALAAEPARNPEKPAAAHDAGAPPRTPVIHVIRRTLMNRYSPMAAAALIALALLVSMLIPATTPTTFARGAVVMAPDGGRLDALDADGNILGPCELTRTDVDVQISGFLTRVTLRQHYRNPHPAKIEAVYTFPMSHRAAVDRMTMTIGDRVIVGEVKEREAARRIYESARAQGRVAGLLEQERPNIFTQSVANIEPGAEIDVEISYVEVLEPSEGRYTFSFPTAVGPRYIPGASSASEGAPLPPHCTPRRGLVLLAPATVAITATNEGAGRRPLTPARLAAALASAHPIEPPHADPEGADGPAPGWHSFTVVYPDGSAETGEIDASGMGHVGGRWFWFDPAAAAGRSARSGEGFARGTDQVPDAGRITPMPVRPPMRAGHDIGITVTIDTGGPAIADLTSPLHEIVRTPLNGGEVASKVRVSLKARDEIPNRDFVLSWSLTGDSVQESIFTHRGEHGGFFTLILQPPPRVAPDLAVPRELIFVLDTSGSMQGYPIEKAKEVMSKAIASMRERDTFNIITFSGDTHILWDRPRPNTPENRAEAQRFLASRRGGGGTEMMKAIEAALRQTPAERDREPAPITPAQLANLPADGRRVTVELPWNVADDEPDAAGLHTVRVRDGLSVKMAPLPPVQGQIMCPVGEPILATGVWVTENGERILRPASARWKSAPADAVQPLRLVTFFTDGYVGNDMAIIDAIRRNRATTRVFSFGIGNSVNRYLLDNMARAGGGEAEYVLLTADADKAVERFARRISTPVLANINVAFSDGLNVTDVLPGPEEGGYPDLFDHKPLVIHGRYTAPGAGTVTITGVTGAGPYTRTIDLVLPAAEPANDTIATLWAREKVESLMNRDLGAAQRGVFPAALRQEVVALGETFNIMTQFTSFVAVDMARVTIGGEPRLVSIPIEMPQGVSWEGIFGGDAVIDIATDDGAATLQTNDADLLGRRMRRDVAVAGLPIKQADPEDQADTLRRSVGKPAAPSEGYLYTLPSVDAPPVPAAAPQRRGQVGRAAPPPASAARPAEVGYAPQAGQKSARDLSGFAVEGEALMEETLERMTTDSVALTPPAAKAQQRSAGDLTNRVRLILRGKDGEPDREVAVPPEAVAAHVADLARAENLHEAANLAAELAKKFPEYRTALEMAETLRNEAIDAQARIAEVRRLAEPARAKLAEARRRALLRGRLAPPLLPFAERTDLPDDLDAAYAGDKPEGVIWKDGGVLVTILVERADAAAAERIAALGARVEDSSVSTNIIVAVVPLGRLDDLALLEGVRRVEPTRFSAP